MYYSFLFVFPESNLCPDVIANQGDNEACRRQRGVGVYPASHDQVTSLI